MKKNLIKILFVLLIVAWSGCSQVAPNQAKYVFLFIGDGMGLNQVYSTQLFKAAQQGVEKPLPLSFTGFPVTNYVTTYSANNKITDSGAAGTAIATGYKTNNGVIGKDPTLTKSYTNIAEVASENGYKVGVVSSVTLDHATPASFYAHQDSRGSYYEISMQLPQSGFDYFAGGGFRYPDGKDGKQPNIYDVAVDKGYTYVNTTEEFKALNHESGKVLAPNPVRYPGGEFYWAIDEVEGALCLADFTQKGIEVLKNDKGFFMMVEGGKIDWACHANDVVTSIYETLAFEQAVAKAVEFYQKYPDETLIIVTSDHETGGLGTGNTPAHGQLFMEVLLNQKISTNELERTLVGMSSTKQKVTFNKVLSLFKEELGLGSTNVPISENDKKYLKEAFNKEFGGEMTVNPDADYLQVGDEKSLAERAIYLLNQKAGIEWTTAHHTAMPVPLKVLGAGQKYFESITDNTEIKGAIEEAMGIQ